MITGNKYFTIFSITSLEMTSAHVDLGVGKQVVRLVLVVQQRLLVTRRPHPAQAGDVPQSAGLDIPSESDDIQDNEQGDSKQAEPDNVVRVEVPGGHGVAVVHPVVDVLLLTVP